MIDDGVSFLIRRQEAADRGVTGRERKTNIRFRSTTAAFVHQEKIKLFQPIYRLDALGNNYAAIGNALLSLMQAHGVSHEPRWIGGWGM
jgi:hypothetical protein